MPRVINWDLIIHPVNWLIILLVLYFAALMAHMIYQSATSGTAPFNLPSLSS